MKFVGEICELGAGIWIGVQFDEPVGKNDGSAKGRRIFVCEPNYGGFHKPENVQCGDFPPDDPFAEL